MGVEANSNKTDYVEEACGFYKAGYAHLIWSNK